MRGGHEEDCPACNDFKSFMLQSSKMNNSKLKEKLKDCPLDRTELGNRTWSFLHTMAAYYPKKPTEQQKSDMVQFIGLFSKFFPCKPCAEDFQRDLREHPADVQSRESLSAWFCKMHNIVNVKIGKQEFDCSKVLERWRDGYKDGRCDF